MTKRKIDHVKLAYRHLNKMTYVELRELEKNLPQIINSVGILQMWDRNMIVRAKAYAQFWKASKKLKRDKATKITFNAWKPLSDKAA